MTKFQYVRILLTGAPPIEVDEGIPLFPGPEDIETVEAESFEDAWPKFEDIGFSWEEMSDDGQNYMILEDRIIWTNEFSVSWVQKL